MPLFSHNSGAAHRLSRGRAAFTLLELMLVSAVAAVLMVLALVAVSSVQRKSRTAACAGQLRAIGVGLAGYLQEKGHYPGLQIDSTPRFWHHALVPYMTGEPMPKWSYEVRRVPSWVQCRERDRESDEGESCGYGYNQMFGNLPPSPSGTPSTFDPFWQLRPSQITAPAKTVVIGDNHDRSANDLGFSVYALHNGSGVNNRLRARRHGEGGNYLYADGHVEWITARDMARRLQVNDKEIFRPFYEN